MDERALDEATAKVLEICRTKITAAPVEIHADTSLVRDLGLDSLQALELISEIESSFGLNIPSELLPEVDTVRDVARMIVRVKFGAS